MKNRKQELYLDLWRFAILTMYRTGKFTAQECDEQYQSIIEKSQYIGE